MMKKYFLTITIFFAATVFAQPAKQPPAKSKNASQSLMDKAMEDAMKGMSTEEKAEMREKLKEAVEVADEMKKAGIKGSNIGTGNLKIPVKQTGLLRQIKAVDTQQELISYIGLLLAECKKNTAVTIVAEVDKMIGELNKSENELAGMPITLFLNKNVKAAVYAAMKILSVNSSSALIQNNSAFILQQSGYPGKAVPVFKYLQQKYNTADFCNNLAQSYLSLGEKEEAKKYFRMGLSKDPNYAEMHCGLGLIFSAEGHEAEAVHHISESLKNGYSEVAEALAKKHKVKIKFSDLKSKAPEYFNPQKYTPAKPAGVMEDIPIVELERLAMEERHRQASRKAGHFTEKVSAAQNQKTAKDLMHDYGNIVGAPFSRKALYMIMLINEERFEFFSSKFGSSDYKNKDIEYRKEFDAGFERIQHTSFGNDYSGAKQCQAHVANLNTYLQRSKTNYENFERAALPKMYDYTNQSIFWQSFLLKGDAYLANFYSEVEGFYGALNSFSQLQNLYPTPGWIYSTCKNFKAELDEMELEEIEAQLACPINIKLPAGKSASFKINCKSMELEGGEVLKLSFERDTKTGEFSLGFGLGIDANTGMLNAGLKGLMYFKFASDFSPIDMGIKGEAGVEAELFTFSVDEKITGTMGISSVNLEAVHLGETINIFKADAVTD